MNLELVGQQAYELIAKNRLPEAEALLRPVFASGSGPIVLWRMLVQSIRPQGKIIETRAIQEMVVQTLPGDLTARFDLSETLLLLGDFARGWREYRFRYSLEHTIELGRRVQRPRWEGQSLKGKTLLIHDEQGYGDTFQFLRMVAWAKKLSGARVILEINIESLSIAQRCIPADDIIVRGTIPPHFDFHCELMSLPMAMNLQLTDLPGTIPYLTPDPQPVTKWRDRLENLHRPLVAFVWAGRPTHTNDVRRSMALSDLAPLAQSGVTFLSIQKGPASTQALTPPEGMNLLSLSDEIQDFEDTAAILSIADLLISVDSSPVHLAGALGCPTWVMLPFVPDWRWLLEREDTPWYPDVRLFRQSAPNDWNSVLNKIGEELPRLQAKQD